ncbi:hypothetical protein [Flavobacterium chilense]|uniref:Uncharacterized protein n=1 Tax=Flavobacterium chilense TaxID=946677 RepID=A0A1M7N4I2_9FLAO|nr:hypothetical protein [Flavobacterium chilense]SHM98293.1 hypothetical protein SAMN05444484_11911 [Flavobacterium chilense]
MGNKKINFIDFETEKLSKDQQKAVYGGDVTIDVTLPLGTVQTSIDPTIGVGKGSN